MKEKKRGARNKEGNSINAEDKKEEQRKRKVVIFDGGVGVERERLKEIKSYLRVQHMCLGRLVIHNLEFSMQEFTREKIKEGEPTSQ